MKHLEVTRKYRVTKQKWNKALIYTEIGINQTGTFRDFTALVREEISLEGDRDAVLQNTSTSVNSERKWSKPLDGDIL